jgi:hypothetical protein
MEEKIVIDPTLRFIGGRVRKRDWSDHISKLKEVLTDATAP